MKPFATIYVIETNYEARVITLGASLSEETAEQKLAEIRAANPGRARDYWVAIYRLTDEFVDFDMF